MKFMTRDGIVQIDQAGLSIWGNRSCMTHLVALTCNGSPLNIRGKAYHHLGYDVCLSKGTSAVSDSQ